MNCLTRIYCKASIERIPRLLLLLSASLMAALVTFVVYPGVLHADCYIRAECAEYIIENAWPEGFTPYVTLLPSVFIAIPLWLTGNLAAYTWLQAVFFLWSLFEFLCKVCKNYIFAVLSFFLLSPLLVGYSVFWDSRVLAAILLLWLIVLDQKIEQKTNKWVSILIAAAYSFAVFVITGYVINAATAIVGLLIWNIGKAIRYRKGFKLVFLKIVSALLGIVLALQVPMFLGLPKGSNATTGMLWEMACIVNRIGPGNGYNEYLDDILGEGETSKVFGVEKPEKQSVWAFQIDYNTISAKKSGDVLAKYVRLIKEKPIEFIRTKLSIVEEVLVRADFNAYYENQNGRMQDFGMQDSTRRTQAIGIVNQYMKFCVPFRIPILMFAIAGILALMGKVAKIDVEQSVKILWVAVAYEGGFFLTTQAYVFRYYFPAFLLIIFVILELVADFIGANVNKKGRMYKCGCDK